MNKNDIKLASEALKSGLYELTSTSGGRAAALAKFCKVGNPGEALVRNGWSEETFAYALGTYLAKLAEAGHGADVFASSLKTLGGCNSSAASKAAGTLTFVCDGLSEKPTLDDVWTACLGGSRKVASSSLIGLDD